MNPYICKLELFGFPAHVRQFLCQTDAHLNWLLSSLSSFCVLFPLPNKHAYILSVRSLHVSHKENDMGAKIQVNQTGKFSYYKIRMRLEMSIFRKLLLWSISSSLSNFASAIWVSTDSPPEGYQAEWPTQLQMGTNMSSVVLLRSPGGLWQLVCLVKPLIKHKQSIPH